MEKLLQVSVWRGCLRLPCPEGEGELLRDSVGARRGGSRHSSYLPAANPGDAEDTDYPIMCLLILLCGGSEQLISCAVKYNLLLSATSLHPFLDRAA